MLVFTYFAVLFLDVCFMLVIAFVFTTLHRCVILRTLLVLDIERCTNTDYNQYKSGLLLIFTKSKL